ncbi:DUF2293 domain-containing protein [Mangrovibacterium marinum]|uniref:Uncharacterized protein DUF2293 n=1 Tax=Mangrovibacterium marinum TaxID=1639118 RepID=A0A2T5C3A2_9BACT|nr:DUF2293 domain-containing protein [Mangrovibacterium marinum]PTN09247.1 uncharacterized protein DUF2293 [Mangrovibacterium marinum]
MIRKDELIQIVSPGKKGQLLNEYGMPVTPPSGWSFLPAGDSGITRKVTAQGKYWRVQYKKGRKTISKGVWAPAETIVQAQQTVAAVRKTDGYQRKRAADLKRREQKQEQYEDDFLNAVIRYLNFHDRYDDLAERMAMAITEHAVPVGSGTVARTQMIPLEERAAKAVIAWMRHQTTAYEKMRIARVKGERRAVRRELAQQSVRLLHGYRTGQPVPDNCPLRCAIEQANNLQNQQSNE